METVKKSGDKGREIQINLFPGGRIEDYRGDGKRHDGNSGIGGTVVGLR